MLVLLFHSPRCVCYVELKIKIWIKSPILWKSISVFYCIIHFGDFEGTMFIIRHCMPQNLTTMMPSSLIASRFLPLFFFSLFGFFLCYFGFFTILLMETKNDFGGWWQRGHQNSLELMPMFFMLMIVGGIKHPLICASLGLVYIMGRYLYFTGYATGNPKNRNSRW